MADASNVQTGFLGGEFSPYAQGVLDDPEYKKGMNVCRNVIPIETGAATRRTGTKELAFTRKGQVGRLLNFQFTGSTPYTMEFTDGYLRFYDSQQVVLAEEPRIVQYINQAAPAVLKISATCSTDWADGDTVVFNDLKPNPTNTSFLMGRQFVVRTGSDVNHWLLFDALTGQPVDGSVIAWTVNMAIQVARVFEFQTPYVNGAWQNLRATQSDDMIFLWHPNLPTRVIFAPVDGGSLFTINTVQFLDGPYLDPPTDGSYLTTTGISGAVTLGLAYPAWSSTTTYANGTRTVNNTQKRGPSNTTQVQYTNGAVVSSGGNLYVSIADGNINHSPPNASWWKLITVPGFQSTDVGRSIRLFARPAAYDVAHAYSAGDLVTYQNAYYTALVGSTGKVPGTDATNWGVAANAAQWTWGIITAVASSVSITVAIQGDPLLYNANIPLYRLGVFSDTTGYPSCGAFHEGRLWTGGVIENRFDASATIDDNLFNFSPTSPDGTVSDANGISETLRSKQRNQILWMNPALGGILMGTCQAEWLVQASSNNDPLTPTNIQSHDHTSIGSADVEAVRCGTTVAFVQRYGNQVIEYLADLFSGKPAGKNLAVRAKHLTGTGVVRMGYQQETFPVLWMLTSDGKLLGSSYKRESLMVSQPPSFNGWHRHDLGSGYKVIDLVVGSAPGGLYETATIMTQDPATGYCRIEAITEAFQETSTISDAWFLDSATSPKGGQPATVAGKTGITFGGLGNLEGKTVTAWVAGLDLGDYTVANGQIFVPYQSDPDKLFTLAYVAALNSTGYRYPVQIAVPSAVNAETIMEFPPISSTVLNRFSYLDYGLQAITDWRNDRVTFMLPGTTPECGFIQYKISTGAFIQYVTMSTIFGSVDPPFYDNTLAYTASPKVVGSDNFIYTAQVSNSFGVDPTSSGQTDWFKNPNGLGNPSTLPSPYDGAHTYSAGDFATRSGFIYKSLVNSNTGHDPVSSPTQWQSWYATPAAWSASTTYGAFTPVTTTATNGHVFWPLGDVPAGNGDPNTFSVDNNPYWQTNGAVWPGGVITTGGLGLDYNGDIWMYQSGTIFNSTYVKFDGSTLKMKGYVTKASGLSIPTPSNVTIPMRIQKNDGSAAHDFMLETVDTTPSGSSAPAAVVMDVTGMRVNSFNTVTFDEGNKPIAVSGASEPGWAQSFVLTRIPAGGAIRQSLGLYEVDVVLAGNTLFRQPKRNYIINPNKVPELLYGSTTSINKRKAGTIAPSDIDPTWTFFSGVSGMVYDPNDGNVMFFAGTANPSNWAVGTTYGNSTGINDAVVGSDGKVYYSKSAGNVGNDPTTDAGVHWTLANATTATQLQYLVKFTVDCARQVWRIATTASPSQTDLAYPFIDVSSGWWDYLEDLGLGSYQIRRIDTLAGQSSIIFPGQGGLTQLGATQVYNSKTGDIIFYGTYDHSGAGTSPPPTQVNPVGGTTPTSFTAWARLNVTPNLLYTVPGAVGFTFTSQGQLLRPVAPAETGARNGPAFGKTRRNHRYAMACANSQGVTIGSDLTKSMRPAKFKSLNGNGAIVLPMATLYTGEHSDTVEGDYNLDGMLAFQITRPYPATVTAFGGFLQTQDR